MLSTHKYAHCQKHAHTRLPYDGGSTRLLPIYRTTIEPQASDKSSSERENRARGRSTHEKRARAPARNLRLGAGSLAWTRRGLDRPPGRPNPRVGLREEKRLLLKWVLEARAALLAPPSHTRVVRRPRHPATRRHTPSATVAHGERTARDGKRRLRSHRVVASGSTCRLSTCVVR